MTRQTTRFCISLHAFVRKTWWKASCNLGQGIHSKRWGFWHTKSEKMDRTCGRNSWDSWDAFFSTYHPPKRENSEDFTTWRGFFTFLTFLTFLSFWGMAIWLWLEGWIDNSNLTKWWKSENIGDEQQEKWTAQVYGSSHPKSMLFLVDRGVLTPVSVTWISLRSTGIPTKHGMIGISWEKNQGPKPGFWHMDGCIFFMSPEVWSLSARYGLLGGSSHLVQGGAPIINGL